MTKFLISILLCLLFVGSVFAKDAAMKFPTGTKIIVSTPSDGGYITPPTNSNDPGTLGQWSIDSTYLYYATGTNTWIRGNWATIGFATWASVNYFFLLSDNTSHLLLSDGSSKLIIN